MLQPLPMVASVCVLLSLVFAVWVGSLVKRSSYRNSEVAMSAIRDASAGAVEIWLEEEQAIARAMAKELETHTSVLAHLSQPSAAGRVLLEANSATERLNEMHSSLPSASQHLGWFVLDRSELVVFSSEETDAGVSVQLSDFAWKNANERHTGVSLPFSLPWTCGEESSGVIIRQGDAVMAATAPLQAEGRVVGLLALVFDPCARFSEVLAISQAGQTGETFAFDRQGVLISRVRNTQQLREAGLLPHDANVRCALNVTLADPGVNLVKGGQAALPRNQQSLTKMAESATRGGTGADGMGYHDYRGVSVVGAWTWLEKFQFGIATKMDVEEAHKPLRQLNLAFLSLVGLLATVGGGFLGLTLFNYHLQQKADAAAHRLRRLGNYELLEEIGTGGMGTVYRGRHQLLRRPVAVKVLEASGADPKSIRRFEREVQRTSELKHPNTIQVYDYGHTADSTFFYVMELVEGVDLTQLVETFGPQSPGRVISILKQVCGSLAEAHDHGLVHRDIKPGNLLLSAPAGIFDFLKVVDFGLVKETLPVSSHAVTRVESLTGTPLYMSPEAIRDASGVDGRSDIYSLGAVGYYLLTGSPLFDAKVAVDICMLQVGSDPMLPSERLGKPLPADLERLLMKCLEKKMADRPQTIREVVAQLTACESASSWTDAEAAEWWVNVYDEGLVHRGPVASLLSRGGSKSILVPGKSNAANG
ncbi:Serine/threonine-protein kinase PknB [Roseimaritima multifibrata]|uniref:Serine/threonine-protein kinase PknB n=1 Tax=Roseimaritima multifibrata TaxID=1930274 RepID=A0A517MEM1_9BACT|nr:protein kinase [Roseimaritima multifibrata]QDS93331.1 Serine/threonine-protein kinase PknB [Roseimaritima multifibrata]